MQPVQAQTGPCSLWEKAVRGSWGPRVADMTPEV